MRDVQKFLGTVETVRDSPQLWKTVRDLYQLHWTGEMVRESQQLWEIVIGLQLLHGTERDSERKPETMRGSERHVATIGDSKYPLVLL